MAACFRCCSSWHSARSHGRHARTAAAVATVAVAGVVIDARARRSPARPSPLRSPASARTLDDRGADGRFSIEGVPVEGGDRCACGRTVLRSRWRRARRTRPPARSSCYPRPLTESVTVTASRGATGVDTAASASIVSSAELLTSAAGAIDDALRNTPGFSLFRRSSSRVANPTTQGVTLRGVSGSGASRTLVVADGWALNDPFGSWVYWNRIPLAAVDRIEVVRGADRRSLRRGRARRRDSGADARRGSAADPRASSKAARTRPCAPPASAAAASATGRSRRRRGPAHRRRLRRCGSGPRRRWTSRPTATISRASASAGYAGGSWRATLRGHFAERGSRQRHAGPGQRHRVAPGVGRREWHRSPAASGRRASTGGSQDYFQTFSAIAADRQTERLTERSDDAWRLRRRRRPVDARVAADRRAGRARRRVTRRPTSTRSAIRSPARRSRPRCRRRGGRTRRSSAASASRFADDLSLVVGAPRRSLGVDEIERLLQPARVADVARQRRSPRSSSRSRARIARRR